MYFKIIKSAFFRAGSTAIDCPKCNGGAVPAEVVFERETTNNYVSAERTWVDCSACGLRQLSDWPVEELKGKSPEELAPGLRQDVPAAMKVLSISALATSFIPAWGTLLALVALVANAKTVPSRWPKRFAKSAMAISFLSIFALIALGFILAAIKKR